MCVQILPLKRTTSSTSICGIRYKFREGTRFSQKSQGLVSARSALGSDHFIIWGGGLEEFLKK